MENFLALPPARREFAFQQAGVARGLAAASVEKDFWVCLMLRELFNLPECGDHLTFKGGTSLSKAWGLIDRFSEDIDLTIERDVLGFGGDDAPDAAPSGSEQKRRLNRLKHACHETIATRIAPTLQSRMQSLLARTESWSLTSDDEDPDGLTLLFAYPRVAVGATPSYVNTVVKLEFGARSDPWPVAHRTVTSILAEEFPDLMRAPASIVRALLPERTFWEKVLLLHEDTFRPKDTIRRPRMARHYYDVWRLIEAGVAGKAATDLTLFEQVVAHRKVYFKYGWVNYNTMKRGSIQILPQSVQIETWRRDYSAMQGEMFVGTPPTFDEILASVAVFQTEFNAS